MRKMMTIALLGCLMFWYGVALAVDLDGKWFCMVVADADHVYEYNMTISGDKYEIAHNGNVVERGTFVVEGNAMRGHSESSGAFSHKIELDDDGQMFRLTTAGGHSVEYLREDD